MGDREPLQGQLVFAPGEGMVYGPGSARAELARLLRRVGSQRPFLVTTGSVVSSGLADEVAAMIGPDLVGRFAGSKEHTPGPVVLAGAAEARAAGADALVALGGSSVVDLAKGIALVLAEGEDLDQLRLRPGADGRVHRPALTEPKIPQIALPTTLSGAEFTGAAGITNLDVGEKQLFMAPGLAPRWIVMDPELARSCPARLWAGTGMKALADTIEVQCSRRANPLSDAVAAAALAILAAELPAATADPDDLDARGRCQFAVAMALGQLASVGVGLVAGLRHQLGGGLGVAHGEASTIVLPHVIGFNADAAAAPLARAARAVGLDTADDLARFVTELAAGLGLPTRLRDVGVSPDDLDGVARHVLGDASVRTNPRPVRDAAEVRAVLDAAW
ncbi:MAG: iron-containing alcohol dehydrogenase [Acidimicrobiia bacterium]|nr:iron-containing alcohol dehydrogenase [Acidimicrobiia bacterium]